MAIIDFRIDSNTYKKDFLKSDELIRSHSHNTIDDLSTSVQNFGAYSLCNDINFVESGIPFLMTKNIRNNYIDWNIEKFVDIESHDMLWKSHCSRGQVLITMAGEYLGRAAVYNQDFICSSNQAIAKVTLTQNENPYYISSFVNSKHGQNQINRLKTITGQPNINMSLIKSLIIPKVSSSLENELQRIVMLSEKITDESNAYITSTEDILLTELELNDWQPTNETTTEKNFTDFLHSGRLDAEYYQPKYDELFEHLSKYETKKLGEIAVISKSIEPGSDAYQSEGVPFIRVSNLSKYGLSQPDIYLDALEFGREVIRPRKDTILLSKDGSVGIAYKVQEDMNSITSGAILHLNLRDDEFLPDYVTLVLNSIIVKMQAERDAGGSIIQHWKPSEIEQVIIPKLSIAKQREITTKIQESFALRAESKRLLDLAKRAVEVAIEQGEEMALELLK